MKFHQLAIGQRFILNGTRYTKTSPLLARADGDTGQKLIARHSDVEAEAGDAPAPRGPVDAEAAVRIVEECRATLEGWLAQLDADARRQASAELERTHQQLLAALGR